MTLFSRSSLRKSSLLVKRKILWLRLWLEVARDLRALDKVVYPVDLLELNRVQAWTCNDSSPVSRRAARLLQAFRRDASRPSPEETHEP